MIKKREFYDRIVHELSIFATEIEEKAANNLLDDNVLSEDFIKDLLNVCKGWNLVNLNTETKKYPGIDLGDKKKRIGVQVTSTKTSKKIIDSLDTIVRNNVDKDYDEIYFFVLGKKQKSYTVDFTTYDMIDCSENNVWDFSDVISWCTHYDSNHIEKVWNIIKREIAVNDTKDRLSIEIKKDIIELKRVINKIFTTADCLLQTHNASITYMEECKEVLKKLDQMISYLDENTYLTCKDVLEDGLKLGRTLQHCQRWGWGIQAKCLNIMDKSLIEKNIQEALELITNDISGMQNGINIVIDGDCIVDRLMSQKIDKDILYKQFSVAKFQKVLENIILRKGKKCIITFSKDNVNYNKEFVQRLEAEATTVVVYENREETVENVCEWMSSTFEYALISARNDILNNALIKKDNYYLYTVSFENDLPATTVPLFFSIGNMELREINCCFNYEECKAINVKKITEEIYKDMLANANDRIPHQLRVDWSGEVYISTITGAEDIDGVKFRWESWDPGNGYVGPRAASDQKYVKQSVEQIKKCWEDGIRGYCDYYAIC